MKNMNAIKGMAVAGALAMSIALVGCGGQSKPAETKTEEKTTQTQQQTTQKTEDTSKTTEQNTSQNSSSSSSSSQNSGQSSSSQNSSSSQSSSNQTQAPSQTQTQTTTPAAQQISADEAKSIALADAGVTAADVRDLKAELDTDDAVVHYDVDFKVGNTEHDYDIDAHTGAIISHKSEIDND